MSGTPLSPRLVKGGIVTMDPDTSTVKSVIALQYNPDSLSRTLQIQAVQGAQDGTRVDALRLRGPAVETIKIDAELDATDQLEFPRQFPVTAQLGLHPQLAQLEMLVNPTVETLLADDNMANAGRLEIIPLQQPLTLFVWSKSRVVPVRLTDFSVTEEAFDPNLNPIRAKVSLGMRVLNVDDLGILASGRTHLHELSHQQAAAGVEGHARWRCPFSVWEACHEVSAASLDSDGSGADSHLPRRQPLLRVGHADLRHARRRDDHVSGAPHRAAAGPAQLRHDRDAHSAGRAIAWT